MGKSAPKPLQTVHHELSVSSAFFSPNGDRLLTTSMDNTVKVCHTRMHANRQSIVEYSLQFYTFQSRDCLDTLGVSAGVERSP